MIYDFGQCNVNIELSKMTPRQYWDDRHEMFRKIQNSMAFYNELSYEHRLVIQSKVKHALAIMYDNVDSWIPESFDIEEPGNRIKIELNLMVADIDQDIEDSQVATSFQLASAAESLKELIAEVQEEDTE